MGIHEIMAYDGEVPFKPYGSSTNGNANHALPPGDLEELRDAMDAEGYGTHAMDPHTGEPQMQPTAIQHIIDAYHARSAE